MQLNVLVSNAAIVNEPAFVLWLQWLNVLLLYLNQRASIVVDDFFPAYITN
jgi:hypothetical protein